MEGVLVDVLPAGELPAGIYIAQSNAPAYAELIAMALAGDAEVLGERYTTGGLKEAAVSVGEKRRDRAAVRGYNIDAVDELGLIPNQEKGQIRIGRQFYASALRDYSHAWPERWWREAVQNAVDAGASKVSCLSEQQPDGTYLVSCEDNGRGMDESTLLDKFLVLGGTTKVAGGTTGGFGKAKELLILPWISWEVHTRNVQVRGAGIEYEVERNATYLDGTRLSVLMPNDQKTTNVDAQAFLGKCYLPGIRFTVNGERVKAERSVGKSVQTFSDKAELFYDEKDTNYPYYMLVRVNGLFMFEQYAYKKPPGLVVLELLRASTEILTANRDGIADSALKQGVEQFMGRLAIEQEVALRTQEGRIRKKFRGTGKFQADLPRLQAAMMERLGVAEPMGAPAGRGERTLSRNQVQSVIEILQERPPPMEETTTISFAIDPAAAKDLLSAMPFSGPSQLEVAVKQLAWQPDFYVVNEIAGFKVPKKFFPDTMTANVRKLARVWSELCRFVLIRMNCDKEYGVGFIFSNDALAECVQEENENWLMLNPFLGGDPEREMFSISKEDHYAELFSLAVHECTHLGFNTSDHDKDFASGLTKAIAMTFGQEKQVRAIKRMVLAVEREEAAERPKKERAPRVKRERVAKARGARDVGFVPAVAYGATPHMAMTGGVAVEVKEAGPYYNGRIVGVMFLDPDTGQRAVELVAENPFWDTAYAGLWYRVNLAKAPMAGDDSDPIWIEGAFNPIEDLATARNKLMYAVDLFADRLQFFDEKLRASPAVEFARIADEADLKGLMVERWGGGSYSANALKPSINEVRLSPLERLKRRPADPRWVAAYDEARRHGASAEEAGDYANEEVRLQTDWGLQAEIYGDE